MNSLLLQFEESYKLYLEYKKKHIIPPKIEFKLNFLAKCIAKDKVQEAEFNMFQQDLDQIKEIDQKGKILLFIHITNCMTGKEQPVQQIKAFLKKDKVISFWQICYLSVDLKNLTIIRKKKQTIDLQEIKISREIKKRSKKFTFSMITKNGRYYLGFSKEDICIGFNKKIQDCMDGKYTVGNLLKNQSIQGFSTIEDHQIRQVTDAETEPTEAQKQQQIILEQEQPSAVIRPQDSEIQDIQNDSEYKIYQNIQSGRLLYHSKKPNCTKISIVIQNSDYENVLLMFSNITQWNPEIVEFVIVAKLDENVFIMYEKHKAYSYNSRPRDFLFMRTAVKKNNLYYVIDRSVQHQEYPEYTSIVRAKIHNRIIVLIPHPQNVNLILLISKMEVDYRGYNNAEDNKKMAIKSLRNLLHFNLYCIQKSFKALSKNQSQSIFNFQKKNSKEIPQFDKSFTPNKREIQSIAILKPPLIKSPEVTSSKKQNLHIQLINQMPLNEYSVLSQKYIDLIVTKQQHHLLPLKYYHNQKPRLEFTPLKQIDDLNNYINQNGDWIINQDQQFVFVNKKVLDAQKNVIKYILKKIGSNMMSGKSIMNMSLPVDIFEKRGLLERSANSFGFAPIFLTQAGKIQDPLEQMKLIINFILSINTLEISVLKPFNPILGETFQGYLANIPIVYQQLSHHPPISGYYMKSNEFQIHGNLQSYAQMGLNSGVGGNSAIMHIKLPINNSHYQCILPPGEISGLVYGDRKFKVVSKAFVINRYKSLAAEIAFGKEKKQIYQIDPNSKLYSSTILGGIYKVTNEFFNKFDNSKHKHKFQGLTKKDLIEKYSTIGGAWNDKVIIDDKVTKTLFDPVPYQIEYEKYPLASNSNYREDIIYLRMNDLAMAQNCKQKLENLQRNDKKLRHSRNHS